MKKTVQAIARWSAYLWAGGFTGAIMAAAAIPQAGSGLEMKIVAIASVVVAVVSLPVAIVSCAIEYFMGWREPME